jgi:hypothetical protein
VIVDDDHIRDSSFEVSKHRAEWNQFEQLRRRRATTAWPVRNRALNCGEVHNGSLGRTAQHPVEPHHADSPHVYVMGHPDRDDTQRVIVCQLEKCFAQMQLGSPISFGFAFFIKNGVQHFGVP